MSAKYEHTIDMIVLQFYSQGPDIKQKVEPWFLMGSGTTNTRVMAPRLSGGVQDVLSAARAECGR